MSTTHEHNDQAVAPAAAADPAGMTLLPEEAKDTIAEIVADNEALEEAYESAEASAEALAEKAHQLDQATEEVLEELKDGQAPHGA
jgi:hypothetical protein